MYIGLYIGAKFLPDKILVKDTLEELKSYMEFLHANDFSPEHEDIAIYNLETRNKVATMTKLSIENHFIIEWISYEENPS